MKNIEYILVGFGIAGLTFCEQLRTNNKSFVVFKGSHSPATNVAGGVINPTVLKRFTIAWKGNEFYNTAFDFYKNLEQILQTSFYHKKPIFRILKSVEEQNDWIVASDKIELTSFLNPCLNTNTNPSIESDFKLGEVNHTAIVDTELLLSEYEKFLQTDHSILEEDFDYEKVTFNKDGTISYKNMIAKKLIFAEGARAYDNPFLPKGFLVGNKGEYIIIKAELLSIDFMLKGPMFIIPLGNNLYKVGATYNSHVYDNNITEAGKIDIVEKLLKMLNCNFEVVDQIAGVRPTVKDRRPFIGNTTNGNPLYFFNGLGTRGLTMAPLLAEKLFKNTENGAEIEDDINIRRFL